ncbi:MAG: LON peptidase substrate-binding domain-containing protein [Planctomycetes bacterium]|nr:LON peptidase substrate-binding domain-containing protein [Planctomycetota bacterium]
MEADPSTLSAGFPRSLPIFPLAEAVLFPGAILPLHIFEPRYRKMVHDLLAGDGLLAMALLQQCSREEYKASPPYHGTVCVGRILRHEPLAGGRSNLTLLGISAGRARSLETPEPYPVAEVTLIEETMDAAEGWYEERVERAFATAVPEKGALEALRAQLAEILDRERIPAALINTCAFTAPILPRHKLELLEETSLHRRLERLLELLERPWQWN